MDTLLKAIVKEDPIVVVAVDTTKTVDKARSIHDTYPTATAALGRLLTGAALLSSMLKDNQRIMLQVIGDGPLKEVVAEADWLSRVRGYVKRPHVHLELKDGKLDVGRAIGKGILNVVKDLGLKEPYQSSVPLQTGEIGEDIAYYLNVSEQIPAAVSLGVFVDVDNSVKASGGFLIYLLHGVREDKIEYLEKRLKNVRPVTSMLLDGLNSQEIIQEAVGLEFTILERKKVYYYCPCNKERVLDAIAALGKEEIQSLLKEDRTIEVKCWFCKKRYLINKSELLEFLKNT